MALASSFAELKQRVCAAIDGQREDILKIADTILHNPELGFAEFKTAELVEDKFSEMGIPYRKGLAVTGVKGRLRGSGRGPTVAILGEMDALVVPDHPCADPVTGAAHACGHNGQIATMLGAALGLVTTRAMEMLDGDVVFFAVPCEEWTEGETESKLVQEGRIGLVGGKCELIRLGEFDDVDMAMMAHANVYEKSKCHIPQSTNGFLAKNVHFIGRASHAASSPHRGINALNAANLALIAINAQRDTFVEQDTLSMG